MLFSRDVYKFTSYKMEAAAKARGLEGKIWAVSGDAVKTISTKLMYYYYTTSSLYALFNENAC